MTAKASVPNGTTAPPDRQADGAAARQAKAEAPSAAPPDLSELRRRLADPFPPDAVGWKPQSVTGNRALAIAYIDARDVMDRLDDVVGVGGWKDEYADHADGTVVCTLSLRLGGEWVPKTDVGGESDQKDAGDRKKAAYSDALKRAAVKWGVGRFLYALPNVWADYDPAKKVIVKTPTLPAWALPGGSGRPGPTGGQDFHRRLQEFDAKLAEQGTCKPGDLVRYVSAAGKGAGHPADLAAWTEPQIELARTWTRAFEAKCRPAAVAS